MSDISHKEMPEEFWGRTVWRVHWSRQEGPTSTWILSEIEPVVHKENGKIVRVIWSPINGTSGGDYLAHIDWSGVTEFAWREVRVSQPEERPERPTQQRRTIAASYGRKLGLQKGNKT